MKIGLIGYGKMGKLIHEVALKRGHTVPVIIDKSAPGATGGEITTESISEAEVLIDFTSPSAALGNLEKAAALGKNYVMGTTGWTTEMTRAGEIVQKSGIGFIWGSNFSLSVQLFFRIVREAAKIINRFSEFDVAAYEVHHRHKMDAPSGTAETLGQILLAEIDRKKNLLLDRPQGKINPEDLHLTTIRVGETPGTHGVIFDEENETIEIKNTSRSRAGFATGAVIAAEFIADKKGFYDFAEVV